MSSTIGSSKSNKFQIGSAEIRIGPLSRAGQLTSADSVGLLQSASVNFANESVDLEGGLPKTLIDTVIVKQTATVQASAYEYTTNNLKVMLNAGVGRDSRPDYTFQVANSVAANATSISFVIPTDLTASLSATAATAIGASVTSTSGTVYTYDSVGTKLMEFNTTPMVVTVAGVETVVVPSGLVYASDSTGKVTLTWTITAPGVVIPANTTLKSTSILGGAGALDLYEGTVSGAVSNPASATSFTCNIPASYMSDKDTLVIYPAGQPQNMSIVVVSSQPTSSGGVTTVNIGYGSKLLFALKAGDIVYRADDIGLGYNTTTQYFTLDVLTSDHATGRPTGFRFWKAAVSSGLDFSYSSDNFGTTPLSFKILKPSDTDLSAGDLASVSAQVEKHPYGLYF